LAAVGQIDGETVVRAADGGDLNHQVWARGAAAALADLMFDDAELHPDQTLWRL
jgi:hypothetical protein